MSGPVLEAGLRNLAAWSLQVGVLALVAALLSRLVPIERPQARLAFGQLLLVLLVALPLLQPWRSAAADVGWALDLAPLGASTSPSSDAPSSALTPAWSAVVAGLLLLGLFVQLARVGVGLARVRSLRRRGRAWNAPSALVALRDELAPRARFIVTDETHTPATCGLRQPVILLPTGFESMDAERQRAIAAHELVHARRGDWLPLVLEEMLKAVLFFHPAVHWLVGRVRLAREQAVDAAVVERLGAREVYLESLVEAARSGLGTRAVPAAPFLRESHLRERVDLLLKEVVMSRVRTLINVGITAVAVLLAVSWAVSAAPLQSAPTSAPARFFETSLATIDGTVEVKTAGTNVWLPATRGHVLRAGDHVRTGPGATAEIRFADGTLFKVQPDSLIEIDESLAKQVSVGARSGGEAATADVPRLVRRANPVYPEDAKADKAEGTFKLEIVIAKDGSVRDARVVASSSAPSPAGPPSSETPAAMPGDPRLAQAALEAVRGWRYEPVLRNGQPVEAKLTVTINFRLS